MLYYERGKLLYQLGRHDDSMDDLEHSISLSPAMQQTQAMLATYRHTPSVEDN